MDGPHLSLGKRIGIAFEALRRMFIFAEDMRRSKGPHKPRPNAP